MMLSIIIRLPVINFSVDFNVCLFYPVSIPIRISIRNVDILCKYIQLNWAHSNIVLSKAVNPSLHLTQFNDLNGINWVL